MQKQYQTDGDTQPNKPRATGGWFKASRDLEALQLIKSNPLAYVLAAVIAHRARWRRGGFNPHQLAIGEALLGDHHNYGMSEQEYRTSKATLQRGGVATFRSTNRGTVGRLMDSRLFSILPGEGNDPANGQTTTQPTTQPTTNKDLKSRRAKSEEGITAANGSGHRKFISDWSEGYLKAHGRSYVFQGAKDHTAVKRLLSSGRTSEQLLSIASSAWRNPSEFNCKLAVSIAAFAGRLNEIEGELAQLKQKPSAPVRYGSGGQRLEAWENAI